jgi:hypothetical protein
MLHCRTRGFAVLKIYYSSLEEPESSSRTFVMNELLWALNVGSLCFGERLITVTIFDSFCLIGNLYIVFIMFQYGRR